MGWMRIVGRACQFVGLAALPIGIVMEISGRLGRRGVAELLLIMVFGFAIFYVGRYLEGFAGPSESH